MTTTEDQSGQGRPVADRIRAAREAAKLSQRQAAERAGMSQPGYARWEGPSSPGDHCRQQLERIAAAIDTTADKLFTGGQ